MELSQQIDKKPNILSAHWADISHNAIIYAYPGGNFDLILSNQADFRDAGWEQSNKTDRKTPAPRESGKSSKGEDRMRSIRRARAQVRRLALANHFKWFVTLTLDKDKIDRYDAKAIAKSLNAWCSNMVQRHGLAYILVPERHKDGAFHFHGFCTDCLDVVDSGHSDKGGHKVYNLPQWRLGFSTAVELYGDYPSAVAYTCKYIGKQDGERAMGRWFYSGGPLNKPDKILADMDYNEIKTALGDDGVTLSLPGKEIFVAHVSNAPA